MSGTNGEDNDQDILDPGHSDDWGIGDQAPDDTDLSNVDQDAALDELFNTQPGGNEPETPLWESGSTVSVVAPGPEALIPPDQ